MTGHAYKGGEAGKACGKHKRRTDVFTKEEEVEEGETMTQYDQTKFKKACVGKRVPRFPRSF